MAKVRPKPRRPLVTGRVLREVAAAMLPFYQRIAVSRSYAREWTTAIVSADLDLMRRLLSSIPALADADNYGTNGIGYFISFPYPLPIGFYTNGTTIPPGMARYTFNTNAHRCIARAVIPLYRELARNRNFADNLAAAIRCKDVRKVRTMVRSLVKTSALQSVTIEENGLALLFRTRFSKHPYRNLLFQERM